MEKSQLSFKRDNLKKINEFSNFLPEKTDDIFKYDFRYAIFEELIKLYMDKNPKILKIPPGIYHGYKALEPGSILMYYLTEKYNPADELRAKPGDFKEIWQAENK